MEALVDTFYERTSGTFDREEIEDMLKQLDACAQGEGDDAQLNESDFGGVLAKLFGPDPEGEAIQVLQNKLFQHNIFLFMDTDQSTQVSRKQLLDGLGAMFSGDTDELLKFRYSVFDVSRTGDVSRQDVTLLVRSFVITQLSQLEAELQAASVTRDQMLRFQEAKEQTLGACGLQHIERLVDHAFTTAGVADPEGIVTFDAFCAAAHSDHDAWDWTAMAATVMESCEDAFQRAEVVVAEAGGASDGAKE